MAATNRRATATTPGYTTFEGGAATKETAARELERTVSACMLFEDTFYESGVHIANRIAELCKQVPIKTIAQLAVRAREDLYLRHVPLWLCVHMLPKNGSLEERQLVGQTIARVIQRADEPAELISLYWKNAGGRKMLPRQLKNGIKQAVLKFNDYQLAKYDRAKAVKLRDAIMLAHVKPDSQESAQRLARVVNKQSFPLKYQENPYHPVGEFSELESPDTWEVALSDGADKKETFTRLISEKKLGYLALLRNLRNMVESGVNLQLIGEALVAGAPRSKALPFRYITASRYAPALSQYLSDAMVAALQEHTKMPGLTYVVVDVSGSMDRRLSAKSEMNRLEAASALAILIREIAPVSRVFSFSTNLVEVPSVRGLPLRDGIVRSQSHGGTYLKKAIEALNRYEKAERVIVITDEQSHDIISAPNATHGYIINVCPYAPALPTKGMGWTRINGFSERVVDWMLIEEN